MRVIDLSKRAKNGWAARAIVSGFKDDWRLVEGAGQKLWFVTNESAPRYRLVSFDLAASNPVPTEVVPQREDILEKAGIVGRQLVLNYMRDAASHAEIVGLDGKPGRALALNGIGTASGFRGKPGDPETFYAFTSFNRPASIFRMNLDTGASEPFAEPAMDIEPAEVVGEQRIYT